MNGCRNTVGAVYMNRASSSAKTMMIGRPSKRWKIETDAALFHVLAASVLVLKMDEIFREFAHRHVLGQDLADDRAAVEHDQPVGDLVDVSEIVLDVDAGVAGRL